MLSYKVESILRKINSLLLLFGLLLSCSYFTKQPDDLEVVVARVGDNFLYEKDIKSLVTDGLSKTDSALLINNYINSWASKQLLLEKAIINLSEEKQEAFNKLVNDYRADLYISAYKEALVSKFVDTAVSKDLIEEYYEANKENFKLNQELIKFQYISLPKAFTNKNDIVNKFKNLTPENISYLDSVALQFKSYSLNDSIWVKATQLMQKVPAITFENKEKYLKKSQFFELEDSLGVYLVKITEVLPQNEIAPLSHLQPTIKEIIINQRKLDFIRNLERDILNEATKKADFEVYN